MATLQRIADLAGVHVSTVAVVLNAAGGNTRVSAATREKVLKAAGKLGYVRNESARRLRTGKSDAVGFIGGDLRNPFFSELAALLEDELETHGLRLVVSHVSAARGHTLEETIGLLHRETVGKIIYWDESASARAPAAKPGVSLLPIGFTTHPRPGVWLDLEQAVRLAVASLAERGARRLGFYAPQEKRESPSVTLRRKIFVDECRRRRLPAPVCLTYAGESWDVAEASRRAEEVLSQAPEVEAFLGFNDVAALALLLAGAGRVKPPRVACFDGTALARCWKGETLVIDLQIREMVRRIAAAAAAVDEAGLALNGRREAWLRPTLVP